MKKIFTLLLLIISINMGSPLSEEEQETAKRGIETFNKILKKSIISQDKTKLNRIKKVGKEITKHIDKEYEWEFVLVEDEALNAFCFAGGKVLFFTGIFSLIENDDQLAAIMSHEMAHVLLKHGSMRSKAHKLLNIPQKVGKELFGDLLPNDLEEALEDAYEAGKNVGIMMPYAREQEKEADREGIRLMINAKYDPYEAIKLWENIKKLSKDAHKVPNYFSTHPSHDQRISTIQKTIEKSER
ncbi:MAG: Peptidase M48-like protein [uncultured Sulfurovum sp.]|uniref:Peptidase M48-like protein n=1 Tax=uncultured Sulfurovum sp. TaxID=269237 RepID=A0A6S6S407_9BACT|nr:MAG: Peptidase M48-like protein [uncultured Sulfurovum sp.]